MNTRMIGMLLAVGVITLSVIPPVALLARNYNRNFFAGRPVEVNWGLANEVWYAQKLTIQWQLIGPDGRTVAKKGRSEHDMPAGTIRPVAIAFTAPDVRVRTDYMLNVTLLAGNEVIDRTERPVNVFPVNAIVMTDTRP